MTRHTDTGSSYFHSQANLWPVSRDSVVPIVWVARSSVFTLLDAPAWLFRVRAAHVLDVFFTSAAHCSSWGNVPFSRLAIVVSTLCGKFREWSSCAAFSWCDFSATPRWKTTRQCTGECGWKFSVVFSVSHFVVITWWSWLLLSILRIKSFSVAPLMWIMGGDL